MEACYKFNVYGKLTDFEYKMHICLLQIYILKRCKNITTRRKTVHLISSCISAVASRLCSNPTRGTPPMDTIYGRTSVFQTLRLYNFLNHLRACGTVRSIVT